MAVRKMERNWAKNKAAGLRKAQARSGKSRSGKFRAGWVSTLPRTQQFELLVLVAGGLFILIFIGTASQAAQVPEKVTGAVMGPPEEVSFLGFWGIIATVFLLAVILHHLRQRQPVAENTSAEKATEKAPVEKTAGSK